MEIGIEGMGVVRNLSMRGALIETCALVKTDEPPDIVFDDPQSG